MNEISGVPSGSQLRLNELVVDVWLGEAPAEPVLRCERRVFHADRTKHILLRQLIEGLLHLILRETGDVEISFSGIAALCAGLEVEGENVLGHPTPVGKPCLVGEAEAWRKELVPGIILDIWINPVGIHGLVELEFLLRCQAQDRLCDDGFGERGDVVERLLVHRNTRTLLAGSRRPGELAVRDIGDGNTGHVVLIEPFGKALDDLHPEVSGRRLGALGQERSAVREARGEAENDKRKFAQRLHGVPFKKRGGVHSGFAAGPSKPAPRRLDVIEAQIRDEIAVMQGVMISDLRQDEHLVRLGTKEVRWVIEVRIGEPGVHAIAVIE